MKKIKIHLKKKNILSFIGVLFIILVIVIVDRFFEEQFSTVKSYEITKDCTVYNNNKQIFFGDIVNLNQSDFVKDDNICILFNLNNINVNNAIAEFESQNDRIEIYLGDKLIYEFGEYSKKAQIQGYPRIRVPLGNDFNGKQLKINIHVNDSSIVNNIQKVKIMNALDADRSYIAENIYILFTGLFLLIGCTIGGLFVIINFGWNKKYRKMIWLAAMGIASSLWILDSFNLLELWFTNYKVNYFIEYESLFLLIVAALKYAYYSFQTRHGKILMRVLVIISCIYIAIVNALQFIEISYFSKYLFVFHIIAIISLISIILGIILDAREKEKESMIMLSGFGVAFIAAGIYIITKYVSRKISTYSVGCIAVALLIFVAVNFMGFVRETARRYISEAERQYLLELAYVDQLTGIGNRRACEKCLKELENSEENVAIFSYDLNGLKSVNDRFGHNKGDEFIKSFTDILNGMDQTSFVGRLGGDEFLAIINKPSETKIENFIKEFQNRINSKNENDDKVKLSYAYGYEVYDKSKMSIQDCLFTADENMYVNKEEGRLR